ncbi:hypothetical protein FDT66_04930 [Polaribacter aestuariivivens]|uniref:Uncharacterized protein n=1 Tax=Polaribacter aestuariivivens TaxID=2304626 RepID=A0A5S3N7I8_9FLAO|nr:hypothetical protein [Polaribacter aestuariivivens]TMM31315.1 hypothetical protein FDT66_04930 [Polaribacter aestuariivivens]
MNIEKEIEDSKNRIEERQSKIEIDLSKLDSKIRIFTNWAWGFVFFGIFLIIVSSIYFAFSVDSKTFELNLLGDFFIWFCCLNLVFSRFVLYLCCFSWTKTTASKPTIRNNVQSIRSKIHKT